jgi:CBS domain-containing protein
MNTEPKPDSVASLMIPLARYPHLRADATIREAILLIHQGMAQPELSGFRRALVLEADATLVGIVGMPTLLLGLEPEALRIEPGETYQGYVSASGSESGLAVQVYWERVFIQGFGHEPERPVRDVAQPVTVTVTPEDKLARALHLMLTGKLLILPVVRDDRVLGVIRLIEIFERLVTQLRAQTP